MKTLEEAVKKLATPLIWRRAGTHIRRTLERKPETLARLLQIIGDLDEKRKEKLEKIIIETAGENDRVAVELVKSYILRRPNAETILAKTKLYNELLSQARDLVSEISQSDPILASKTASMLAKSYLEGELPETLEITSKLRDIMKTLSQSRKPQHEQLVKPFENAWSSYKSMIQRATTIVGLEDTIQWLSNRLNTLLQVDQVATALQEDLKRMTSQIPALVPLIKLLEGQVEKALQQTDWEILVKTVSLVRTLESIYEKIGKAGIQIGSLPETISKAPSLEDSISKLQVLSRAAKAISLLEIDPYEFLSYLETLEKYPSTLIEKTIALLEQPPSGQQLQSIKEAFERGMPPYKPLATKEGITYESVLQTRLGPSLISIHDTPANITDIRWSEDSSRIAISYAYHRGREWTSGLTILDARTWEPLWKLETTKPIWSIDWDRETGLLAVGLDSGEIKVYEGNKGSLVAVFKAQGPVLAMKWIPGGHIAAITGWPSYTVELHKLRYGLVWRRSYHTPLIAIDWSSQALIVVGHYDGTLSFHTLEGRLARTLNMERQLNAVAVNPEKPLIAVAMGHELEVYDLASDTVIWHDTLYPKINHVSWNPLGDVLAVTTGLGQLTIYTPAGSKIWSTNISSTEPGPISWSPKGTTLALATASNKLGLYSMGTVDVCGLSNPLRHGVLPSPVSAGNSLYCETILKALHGECNESRDDVLLADFAQALCRSDLEEAAAILGITLDLDLTPEWRGDAWVTVGLGWSQELLRLTSLLQFVIPERINVLPYKFLAHIASSPEMTINDKLQESSRIMTLLTDALENLLTLGEPYTTAAHAYLEASPDPETPEELAKLLREASIYPVSPGDILDVRAQPTGTDRIQICNHSRVPVTILDTPLEPGQCIMPRLETHIKLAVEGPGGVSSVKIIAPPTPAPSIPPTPTISPSPGTARSIIGKPLETVFTQPTLSRRFSVPVPFAGMQLIGILGTGGFSATLLARKKGRRVAVKIPRKAVENLFTQEYYVFKINVVRALAREYSFITSLKHPHIIRAIEYGVDQDTGIPYLVLEYASNGNLRGLLLRHGPLKPREAFKLAIQMADALAQVHSRGIFHGDVKPENILFTAEKIPRLTDFNVSRYIWATGIGKTIAHTPGYSAPETSTWGLGRPGPWSDIYSLGVVLYESITGRTPLEGIRLEKLLDPVKWIIASMTHQNPYKRPDAREARDLLAGIYDSLEIGGGLAS